MDADILFRKPSVWFVLLVMLSIWVLHGRSSEMVTPLYFAVVSLKKFERRVRMYRILTGARGSYKGGILISGTVLDFTNE